MKTILVLTRRTSPKKAREIHTAAGSLYPGAKLSRDGRGLWQVAMELGPKAVLIELNPAYVELMRRRCDVTPGLALA